ncbi:MAG: CPBP family intramembrane metalloprotease, partial [Candidatus Aminicenantes bacterium]
MLGGKVGFNFKPKSILLFIVGVAICCLTFFSSFFLSSVWGIISSPANWIQNLFQLNTGTFFILAFTQNFFNALWQEIIFRAYLQTRLVKVYGAMWGILLTSIIFVLLHGFIRAMSVMEILTGIVIFSFVG